VSESEIYACRADAVLEHLFRGGGLRQTALVSDRSALRNTAGPLILVRRRWKSGGSSAACCHNVLRDRRLNVERLEKLKGRKHDPATWASLAAVEETTRQTDGAK
jgi:hypothetical protein